MKKLSHIIRIIIKHWVNYSMDFWNIIPISSKLCPNLKIRSYLRKSECILLFFSFDKYAISVRTAGLLPIDACRNDLSYKNDPNEWKQLCIEGLNNHLLNKHTANNFYNHFKMFFIFLFFIDQNRLIDRIQRVHVVMRRFLNV